MAVRTQNSLGNTFLLADEVTCANLFIPTFSVTIIGEAIPLEQIIAGVPTPRLGYVPSVIKGTTAYTVGSQLPDGWRFSNSSYVIPSLTNGLLPDGYDGTICKGPGTDSIGIARPRGQVYFFLPLVPDEEDPEAEVDLIGSTWNISCFNLERIPIGDPT